MQSIISSVRGNELSEPLKKLAVERQKKQHIDNGTAVYHTRSIYRDVLFLILKAEDRGGIDLNAFDKQYALAYSRNQERHSKLYKPHDKPITIGALFCRQYFKPLSLP